MANQQDPRRGTAKEIAKLGRMVAILLSILAIVTPVLWFLILTQRGIEVGGKSLEELDKQKRTIGGYEHIPDPSLSLKQRRVRAITAGVCIDIEGETPVCREDAEDWLIDTYIRLNGKYSRTSPEDITTKSYVWLPDDWEYPIYWRDRPLETIEKGREACNARIKPRVEQRIEPGASEGCSDKVERPGFHLGGKIGGEGSARQRVSRYREDTAWLKKQGERKCKIKFRCAPPLQRQ